MSKGFMDFAKDNIKNNSTGTAGVLFAASDLKNIAEADNKFKALFKTLGQYIFMKELFAVSLVGAFSAFGKSIRSIVSETGSLTAALEKLRSIQGFEKVFSGLMGSADAAKNKVAMLVNFASGSSFKFKDVAEGGRSLEIMTRGAFSGAAALKTVGDAAAATGNGFVAASDIVGQFYSDMRGGQPIDSTAESMRSMGMISQVAADKLVSMQRNGAGLTEVFNELKSDLSVSAGGMDAYKDSIQGVSDEYSKAVQNMKQKFGSPFVEEDNERTKAMTSALNSLSPSVGLASERFSSFTSSIELVFVKMLAWAASFSIVQSAISGLGAALPLIIGTISVLSAGVIASTTALAVNWVSGAAAAVSASSALIDVMISLGFGFTSCAVAMETLAVGFGVLQALMIGGAIFVAVGAIVALGIAFKKAGEIAGDLVWGMSASEKAADSLTRSIRATTTALEAQAKSITTINQKREAEAKMLQNIIDLQDKYSKAKNGPEKEAIGREITRAQKGIESFDNLNPDSNLYNPADKDRIVEATERERKLNEQARQAKLENASPSERVALEKEGRRIAEDRALNARVGAEAAKIFTPEAWQGKDQAARIAENHEETMKRVHGSGSFQALEAAGISGSLRKAADTFYDNAPENSSVSLGHRAVNEKNGAERARLEALAEIQKKDESNATGLSLDESASQMAVKIAEREAALAEERLKSESQISKIKDVGAKRAQEEFDIKMKQLSAEKDIYTNNKNPEMNRADLAQKAQDEIDKITNARNQQKRGEAVTSLDESRELAEKKAGINNDFQKKINLQNLDEFSKIYEDHLAKTGNPEESKKYATEMTNASIQQRVMDAQRSVAVDSMARIGGGGGVEDTSAIEIAKQTNYLQKASNDLVNQILDMIKNGGSSKINFGI